MRKELFLNFALAALMMLASAVLFAGKGPVRPPSHPSSSTPLPFGCTLPPGVNAAEAGCNQ